MFKAISAPLAGLNRPQRDRPVVVPAPNAGEQFHVSMLRVAFGSWQRIRVNSQRDV
jgi:hypothetical protein